QIYRYIYEHRRLKLDTSWGPVVYLDPSANSGQTTASGLVVMNDWVVFTTNGSPADKTGSSPWLSLFAINQADHTKQFVVQPFKAFEAPNKQGYPYSWAASSVSVDPQRNRIFAFDAGPGRLAALELRADGLHTIWNVPQRTTEYLLLTGASPRHRLLVATSTPEGQVPRL